MPQHPETCGKGVILRRQGQATEGRPQRAEEDQARPPPRVSAAVSALLRNGGTFDESHTWLPQDANPLRSFDGNITNPFREKPMIFAPKDAIMGHEAQGKK